MVKVLARRRCMQAEAQEEGRRARFGFVEASSVSGEERAKFGSSSCSLNSRVLSHLFHGRTALDWISPTPYLIAELPFRAASGAGRYRAVCRGQRMALFMTPML